MDELRRDVGEDLLRVVAVHDGAAPEVIARAAVRGEDRRKEPARTRLRGRDRELAPAEFLVDGPHARDELIERGRALLRSEEHTSELQSRGHLVCRLLLEKK